MDCARTFGLVLLVGIMALISGCQSIARGTSQDVAIETEPAGASIALSDGQRCVSPCRLTVARYEVLEVTASKPGCRSAAGRLTPAVTEGAAAVFGVGTVFDYQLGGAYDIEPHPLTLPLVCGEQALWHSPSLPAEDEALLERFGQPAPGTIGAPPATRIRPPPGTAGYPGAEYLR